MLLARNDVNNIRYIPEIAQMNTETGSYNTLWFRFISGLKLIKTNNSTMRANTATRKSPKSKSLINDFAKVPNIKNNMENGRRSMEKGRPEIE